MGDPLFLDARGRTLRGRFQLPLSKSMVNRALLLAALWPELTLSGMSSAKDSVFLRETLGATDGDVVFVGEGGTTLRFAAAFWATQPGQTLVLSGTDRLNARPIAPLVDALNALGAEITYTQEQGQGPLNIVGRKMEGGSIHLGHVQSSQFVTALMLIGPSLAQGLTLEWYSLPSRPYVVMTAALLREAGFEVQLSTSGVHIPAGQTPDRKQLHMEPDWSAVGFWCEAVALSEDADLLLEGFQEDALQGDSKVIHYFEPLGVRATFEPEGLHLRKKSVLAPGQLTYNLIGEPDLAQALVLTLLMKRIPFEVNGLSTLQGKETDRVAWLKKVASGLGMALETTPSSVRMLNYPKASVAELGPIDTEQDHRAAMSLAPLSLRLPVGITASEVVAKSYPEFWDHWAKATRSQS
jgi:3-phosphoshikimate 1-carboxyvinyltransferase